MSREIGSTGTLAEFSFKLTSLVQSFNELGQSDQSEALQMLQRCAEHLAEGSGSITATLYAAEVASTDIPAENQDVAEDCFVTVTAAGQLSAADEATVTCVLPVDDTSLCSLPGTATDKEVSFSAARSKPKKPGAGNTGLACHVCHLKFSSLKSLKRHNFSDRHKRWIKEGGRSSSHLCPFCSLKFTARSSLHRHVNTAHSQQPPKHTCPECGKQVSSDANLRRHVALHDTEEGRRRGFVCESCGVAFHTSSALNDHRAYMHSNERPFTCSQCNMGFKIKSSLRRHLQTHTETRPHLCSVCGQSYKRLSHLKRHVKDVHNVSRHRQSGEDTSSEDEPDSSQQPADKSDNGPLLQPLPPFRDILTECCK